MSALFPLSLEAVMVRRRGKRIVGPVHLVLDSGGPTILIGPNGSGKTTLLRVMHGIERISSGSLRWGHDDPSRHAFVFQTPIVLRRSVADNLAYPLRLRGIARAEVSKAVDYWLDRVGLSGMRDRSAPRLSGGERQKLAIARALIQNPDVLFLDEPCANLDGHTTREIEALLQDSAAVGTHLVMATHNLGQARRIARNVIFMLDGKVHETGPAEALLDRPTSPELAAFLKGDIVT